MIDNMKRCIFDKIKNLDKIENPEKIEIFTK